MCANRPLPEEVARLKLFTLEQQAAIVALLTAMSEQSRESRARRTQLHRKERATLQLRDLPVEGLAQALYRAFQAPPHHFPDQISRSALPKVRTPDA